MANTIRKDMRTPNEISVDIFDLAKSYANKELKGTKARSLLIDALIAEGCVAGFQKKEANAEGKKVYSPITLATRNGIYAGWGAAAVKLANTPTKELSPQGKFEKDKQHKALGSRMNKLSDAIDARSNPVDKGPVARKDDGVAIPEIFASLVKRVKTSKGAGNLDLVTLNEKLAQIAPLFK